LLQRCKQGLQACFVGYGPEFESPALGSHVFQHNQTQVVNGEAALMMLHHFDFLQGSDGLTQRGKDQLAKIAEYLPRNFFPIVIERTPGTPELATARRQVVLNELAHGTFPVPPERVVIAASLAKGLKGAEAEIIYRNMMEQTRVSGVPIPPTGGTGGIGGTGGAARSAGTGTQGGAPGFP